MSSITNVISAITTTPRKAWPDYNLATENVIFNGHPTKYQAIVKDGRFVNFLTKGYKLLPNEDVIKAADEIAARLGGRRAQMDQANKWFKSHGHVVYSPDGYRITAYYEFDKPVDITGQGDYVQKAWGIGNGIDGSSALRVFPVDIRSKCNNIMMHLYSQLSLADGNMESIDLDLTQPVLKAGMDNLKSAQADWQKLGPHFERADPRNSAKPFYSMRHSKGLELKVIEDAVLSMQKVAEKVMQRYKEMFQLKLSVAQAEKLVEKLPKQITQKLDFIKVVGKEVRIADNVTEWKAFNDVSEILTFGKLTFRSTLEQYRHLDQILVAA